VKYQVIHKYVGRFPVALMCGALGVAKSGYYAWRSRKPSTRDRDNSVLLEQIRSIHQHSRCTYGSPRIWRSLRRQRVVGRHRVARLMREHQIRARTVRRFRASSPCRRECAVAPNRLDRQFRVDAPNRVWAADFTYLWCNEGWLYLAVVLDLYSRAVIGWAMSTRTDAQLTYGALQMAVSRRQPVRAVLHHSDQGVQCASLEYQQLLARSQMEQSMSRKANCWDNAVVESFFATMKKEAVHGIRFATREQLRGVIFEWIEVFYNRQRLHSTLGYRSPAQFEADALS
jgi:putative transposase